MGQTERPLQIQQQIEQEIDFEDLEKICEHLTDAIQEIFNASGLYFRIFSRVKSSESIAGKLLHRQYGTEHNPKKLQDLIGIRVVLYYYDDLSICRDIMESTFQMLDHWSRTNRNADEFKATKINGVFRFPAEYFDLYKQPLWSLPIDTTFEIQFRTVFFEGWHEIEHDMRYKSLLSDNQFWRGSEELSRILNCILANLELSDWSLVQLFEQLSYNHYKNKNWELMLKSKFRIHMDDNSTLHPDILAVFDNNRDVAKRFFKCSRKELIRELLKLDTPQPTYNLIVKVLNERIVRNEEISAICNRLPAVREERTWSKTVFSKLETSVLFQLDTPLLHKETRTPATEFSNASGIIYAWMRFKLTPIFESIPEKVCSYENTVPGYDLHVEYEPDCMTFSMQLNHIDNLQVGTLWHIRTTITPNGDGMLRFCHKTTCDMPHGISHQLTFSKPSFMNDLCSKVGLTDIFRLGGKAHFINAEESFQSFCDLAESTERRLPVIALVQQNIQDKNFHHGYTEGYDMNTFTINGMRLAKVVGHYAHVCLIDSGYISAFGEHFGYPTADVPGIIVIFWSKSQKRTPEVFTRETAIQTEFDFNHFTFHDGNLSEKAFRHKLVQLIKDDNSRY